MLPPMAATRRERGAVDGQPTDHPPRSVQKPKDQQRWPSGHRKALKSTPPPPFLLSRSTTSVELLPAPFLPPPERTGLESDGGGGDIRVASNATSTSGARRTSVVEPIRRIAKVRKRARGSPPAGMEEAGRRRQGAVFGITARSEFLAHRSCGSLDAERSSERCIVNLAARPSYDDSKLRYGRESPPPKRSGCSYFQERSEVSFGPDAPDYHVRLMNFIKSTDETAR